MIKRTEKYKYEVRTYNFNEDKLFNEFVINHEEYGRIPRNRFHAFMTKYEREYIRILNSVTLRSSYGIPNDWGMQFVLEE